ncbi:hypothetical protein NZ698_14655 [Chryseobacterium sp. PBS4-4]|uniref:HTH luxR-type domain-containing protein n=1 Tax=Chryseobacterium edaphi TaxID=2976532 RepID=A0ABT2W897_9FLAO|nr:hypothetical protein [Chryseobacterium edaphi]MCU7618438.1 hypothetical protein [Chryseobacterium edaphi]
MKVLLILFAYLTLTSFGNEEGNKYFDTITKELYVTASDQKKIKQIQIRENKKYEESGDNKFLISSKYAEVYLHTKDTLKQLPYVYNLLKVNNDQYEFISIVGNFNIALQLENNSPNLAMTFLNKAISYSESLNTKYFLAHLYHAKGRFYYNDKKYSQAQNYFIKALHTFNPDENLFIASMHNNFALIHDKLNHNNRAIQETVKAIAILENEKRLNSSENLFLMSLRYNLGWYYFKAKNYKQSEDYLIYAFDFYKSRKDSYHEIILTAQKLYDLYDATHQSEKEEGITDYLLKLENQVQNVSDKIILNEIVQKKYLKGSDLKKIKEVSEKLLKLNHEFDAENLEKTKYVSDELNKMIISNINNQYDHDLIIIKSNQRLLLTIIVLSLIIFIVIMLYVRNKIYKERKIAEAEKIILDNNRIILEQDIDMQKEKIKNLHQNLNLKIETEKAFLEHLKKVKRSKKIDTEEILKDLMFKLNNLMQIDKRNYDLMNETSVENKAFLHNLSEKHPVLTNKELQLCLYFRMNLSSKEISVLEDTTDGTVRVYKTKIKSKLGILRETDLSEYLNTI